MDDQNSKIRITVTIAGRPYALKVQAADEPVILRLTKEINDKIRQFQTTYKGKDKQDFIAMTLLTFAVDLHKLRTKTNAEPSLIDLSEPLQEIDNLLDHLLEK
ncbi:MAG: cell division protein ZapA [Bacteroidota bacterium]